MWLGEILAWDSVTSLQVVDIRECVGIIKLLCVPLHTISIYPWPTRSDYGRKVGTLPAAFAMGKLVSGELATASLKNYPRDLCTQ